jgi:hypothetical protein
LNRKGLQLRGKEFNELGYTITKVTDIGLHYWGSIPGEILNSSFRQHVWFPANFGTEA